MNPPRSLRRPLGHWLPSERALGGGSHSQVQGWYIEENGPLHFPRVLKDRGTCREEEEGEEEEGKKGCVWLGGPPRGPLRERRGRRWWTRLNRKEARQRRDLKGAVVEALGDKFKGLLDERLSRAP